MITGIRGSITAALLPAGLALLGVAAPVQAQTGCSQGMTGAQTRTTLTSQQRSARLQAQLQQQINQLQTVLDQLQSGQITVPANNQAAVTQLETRLQQRITQLQTRLQQLQGQQSTTAQSTSQLTPAQLQALRQQQAALVMQQRAALSRGRR
jgi:hypothetical protein